jgi:hypothetical protein
MMIAAITKPMIPGLDARLPSSVFGKIGGDLFAA